MEKGANVLAFEPIPEIAKALEKTLETFIASGRARVFPLGLGREQEEKTIYLSSINAGLNTMSEQFLDLHGKDAKVNSHKKVHITSLDSLLASGALPPIDFIKADVEGYERELLLGSEETIRRFHPKLSICTYHLPDDLKVIPEIITSLCDSSRQNGSPESAWGGDMTLGMIKKRGHSEERSDEGISRKSSGRKYKLKFSGLFNHVYGW